VPELLVALVLVLQLLVLLLLVSTPTDWEDQEKRPIEHCQTNGPS